MDKQLLDYAASKVDEMLAAPSASEETKRAAQAWKDAVAKGNDADAATSTLLDAISAHQTTIDDLIPYRLCGLRHGQAGLWRGWCRQDAGPLRGAQEGRSQVLRLCCLQALPRAAAQVWPRGGRRLPVGALAWVPAYRGVRWQANG